MNRLEEIVFPPDGCKHFEIVEHIRYPDGSIDGRCTACGEEGFPIRLADESEPSPAPIPMFLTCPSCNERHIDAGEFATKPHHTHACQRCGLTWRPAVVPTVGVRFLPGFKNESAEPCRQGLLERLARSLVEVADWVPGSGQAKRYGWKDHLGFCWCDGSKKHWDGCRRARELIAEVHAAGVVTAGMPKTTQQLPSNGQNSTAKRP